MNEILSSILFNLLGIKATPLNSSQAIFLFFSWGTDYSGFEKEIEEKLSVLALIA